MEQIKLTDQLSEHLLKDATIVFDTSSIGLLYEMPEVHKKKLMSILEHYQKQIWLPTQVKAEYMRHKDKFLYQPISDNYAVPPLFKKDFFVGIKSLIEKHKGEPYFHPYLDEGVVEDLEKKEKQMETAFNEIKTVITSQYKKREGEIKEIAAKPETDVIYKLFSAVKVGAPFSYTEFLDIVQEGDMRYRYSIPPGYMDIKEKKADGVRVFGDLIIWKEILRYAKDNRKPVLFVCDDVKEDWYKSLKNEKKSEKADEITPREELLREFSDVTGQKCWIFPLSRFIKFLESKLTDTSVLRLFEGLEQVLYVIEKKEQEKQIRSLNLDHLRLSCGNCGCIFEADLSDKEFQWEIESISERSMGDETEYSCTLSFECPHCGNVLELTPHIWEYPIGTFNYKRIDCEGGIILRNRVIWQNYIDFFNNEGVCEKCGKHGPIGDDGLCEECSNQYAYGID